jgi:hypothetical protein
MDYLSTKINPPNGNSCVIGEPLLIPYYLGPIPSFFNFYSFSFYHYICMIIGRLMCVKWENKVVFM